MQRVKQRATALVQHKGETVAVDFLAAQLAQAIAMLPKTKQKLFFECMDREMGNTITVTVKNILSGNDVQLRWDEVGTCCDPSTERYHSM